jgi:hypothetical protein
VNSRDLPGAADPAAQEIMSHCYHRALATGLAGALGALHDAVSADVLPCGPGGHALLPAHVPGRCGRLLAGARTYDASTWRVEPIAAVAIDGQPFIALRCQPDGNGSAPGLSDDVLQRRWVTGLAWLRLGASERLLANVLGHLRERSPDGVALLDRQMVRAALSDALAGLLQARAALSGFPAQGLSGAPLAWVHQGITAADHLLLGLLGAGGYLQTGPGQAVYLSGLIENVYGSEREAREDDDW